MVKLDPKKYLEWVAQPSTGHPTMFSSPFVERATCTEWCAGSDWVAVVAVVAVVGCSSGARHVHRVVSWDGSDVAAAVVAGGGWLAAVGAGAWGLQPRLGVGLPARLRRLSAALLCMPHSPFSSSLFPQTTPTGM